MCAIAKINLWASAGAGALFVLALFLLVLILFALRKGGSMEACPRCGRRMKETGEPVPTEGGYFMIHTSRCERCGESFSRLVPMSDNGGSGIIP
jgi:hypothetical protein